LTTGAGTVDSLVFRCADSEGGGAFHWSSTKKVSSLADSMTDAIAVTNAIKIAIAVAVHIPVAVTIIVTTW